MITVLNWRIKRASWRRGPRLEGDCGGWGGRGHGILHRGNSKSKGARQQEMSMDSRIGNTKAGSGAGMGGQGQPDLKGSLSHLAR